MIKINKLSRLTGMCCTLLFMSFVPAQSGATNLEASKSKALSAMQKSRDLWSANQTECKADGDKVHYIGHTGKALKKCLMDHPQAKTLVITSWGGEVTAALDSANVVAERNMAIHILGICFSSCGNYIVPAAKKLTVLPYSAIALHGAPPKGETTIRTTVFEALKKAGLPEEQITEELLDEQVQTILNVRYQHEAFQKQKSVGSAWYDLDFLSSLPEEADLRLIVSMPFIKACLPSVTIEQYWYATTTETIKTMRSHLAGHLVFLGHDVERPVKC